MSVIVWLQLILCRMILKSNLSSSHQFLLVRMSYRILRHFKKIDSLIPSLLLRLTSQKYLRINIILASSGSSQTVICRQQQILKFLLLRIFISILISHFCRIKTHLHIISTHILHTSQVRNCVSSWGISKENQVISKWLHLGTSIKICTSVLS